MILLAIPVLVVRRAPTFYVEIITRHARGYDTITQSANESSLPLPQVFSSKLNQQYCQNCRATVMLQPLSAREYPSILLRRTDIVLYNVAPIM